MTTEKKKHLGLKVTGGIIAVLIIGSVLGGGSDEDGGGSLSADTPTSVTTPEQVADPKPVTPTKPKVRLTVGQENAIGSAENYLGVTSFSRKGLITQLKYEKYSASDAEFAVDHVKVDWNKQAVDAARKYLDLTSFSHGSLVTQLKYDGFTSAQAEHGVKGAGL